MRKLTHADLYSLEVYARERVQFRNRVLEHKKSRRVALGAHMTLLFEDRLTIQYQVQEMLRVERIFEPDAIAEELETYNALIPDGSNLKATLLIEFGDPEVRKRELVRMHAIEERIEIEIEDQRPVFAIADEDMSRSNETKTSAVHFLRFELTPSMIRALKARAPLAISVDHPAYSARIVLDQTASSALVADLD